MPIERLGIGRIGQLTGTSHVPTDPGDPTNWPHLVDPIGNPLLTDTGRWGVIGVDEGANCEHSDGRLYVFFGDVATDRSGAVPDVPPENSDLVAWVDERTVLTHGGHQAMGLLFQLPDAAASADGQDRWQFCLKCSALFWNGDPNFKGACPLSGGHDTFGLGINFRLPLVGSPVPGQQQWRFCGQCAGLFWNGDPTTPGTCPAGGSHAAIGLEFSLPTTPSPIGGQRDWRFCVRCHGLFWDGEASKGVCSGSPGGGVHLRAVTQNGSQVGPFDHFRAPDGSPLRYTGPLETPNGAFSFDGIMYVFAGISAERWSHVSRPENPAFGAYLFSKRDPSAPGPWNVEFLFSPRLGACATDASRSQFDSHNVLGNLFFAMHDLAPALTRASGFRLCRKCGCVFEGAGGDAGVCQRGDRHAADPAVPDVLCFDVDQAEDEQNQSNWRVCTRCSVLFWAGAGADTGLCPAGSVHTPGDLMLRVPHASIHDDGFLQEHWRFCRKCSALFWNGDGAGGRCPVDQLTHERAGFDFLVRHHTPEGPGTQGGWRLCSGCGVMFSERAATTACPVGGPHTPIGWEFTLADAGPETPTSQIHWVRCVKCATLYFDGFPDEGRCPADQQRHQPDPPATERQLPHNPGEDGNTRGNLQFCIRCHALIRTDQPTLFPWLAPVVVTTAEHAVVPAGTQQGLVMIGYDWRDFRLAWLPLTPGSLPRLDSVQYFHRGKHAWTDQPDSDPGYELFSHSRPGQYTHVSALWLPGPRCWVVTYSLADGDGAGDGSSFDQPIVARFSTDLLTWSEEIPLFAPGSDGAYGAWMHDPTRDRINPDVPPHQPDGVDNPGWPYGAFLLERYTKYDAGNRVLDLYFLMSTSSPYQVQFMHCLLRLPDPVV